MVAFPATKSPTLVNASTILSYAVASIDSMLEIYEIVTASRGRGAPTTEEQDLLRAIIMFAGAGLEAVIKQIVQDGLFSLAGKSAVTHAELQKFVARQLVRKSKDGDVGVDANELAALIVAPTSARSAAIERWKQAIAGDSLQSFGKLQEVLKCLGVADLHLNKNAIDAAFEARNRIIHEMDMNLSHPTRKRTTHKRDVVIAQAKLLLKIASDIMVKVDVTLAAGVATP